jgi:cytochrome P450
VGKPRLAGDPEGWSMTTTPPFDPHSKAFLADPYPVYDVLRRHDPFAAVEIGGREIHVVARHADVKQAFSNPRAMQRPLQGGTPPVLGDGPAARMFESSMSQADPPQHTRLRRLAAAAFSPRVVTGLQQRINEIVAGAFDDVRDRDEFDVVEDFALKIPMRVICEIMGIPEDEWPELLHWTPDVLRVFMPEGSSAAELDRCHDGCAFFFEYLGGMIANRRRTPHDDLTGRLVAANDESGDLSDDEMCGVLRGLITAGFETTTNTIAAAALGFATFPEQLALLSERPDLIDGAAEEFLRWEAPVQAQPRYMHADIEFSDGQRFEAGVQLWLLIGSAKTTATTRRCSATGSGSPWP